MAQKKDVWQGTLALMALKTLDTLGPLHGYGIARRIEQTSGDLLAVNYGTLYPALLKLEQEGYISSEWGVSDNNRKAKYYKLTRAGKKQLEREARARRQTTAIVARLVHQQIGIQIGVGMAEPWRDARRSCLEGRRVAKRTANGCKHLTAAGDRSCSSGDRERRRGRCQ